MRIYRVIQTGVTISAAQDLVEINTAAGKLTRIMSIYFGQSSDAGDAEDEQLPFDLLFAHSTSGSGGSSFTPRPCDPGDAAFGGTVEINNTTVATGGTPTTEFSDCFNIRGGLAYRPIVLEHIIIPVSTRAVVRITAPADAITGRLTMFLGEEG